MLVADSISYFTGAKAILSECSLTVTPGVFTAVVGPNGAGKTSLLKIMAHETRSYRGEVRLNDVPISKLTSRAISQFRAVLPQHSTVNFPFTIEQIIQIGRYAHLTTQAENDEIIREVMSLTALDNFKGRTYQTLSGGEQQRVQMARVMAQVWDQNNAPKFLLLDEPTSSLDLAQQHALLSLAKGLCQRNIGVLAIIHDLNLAAQYADEVLFLKDGKSIAFGPTRDVMNAALIEKTFEHPVKVIFDDEDGHPIIYPLTKIKPSPVFDKSLTNYAYEQHSY